MSRGTAIGGSGARGRQVARRVERAPPTALAILLAAVATAGSLGRPVRAGQAPEDERADAGARQIYQEVMSPYCPGLLLANCPSAPAERLRQQIHSAIVAGVSTDAVRAQLIERFGDRVLAAPVARGFGLAAWLTPALFVAAGGVVAVVWLRRRRVPFSSAGDDFSRVAYDPAVIARLEEELRRS